MILTKQFSYIVRSGKYMAGSVVTSSLDIILKDDVSASAQHIAASLLKMAAEAKQVDEALARSGGSTKMQSSLKALGASATQVEGVAKALKDYAAAEGLAADRGSWTKQQADGYRNLESVSVSATRAMMSVERAQAEQRQRNASQQIHLLEQEQRASHRLAEQQQHAMAQQGFGHFALTGAAMALSAHGVAHVGAEAWKEGAELQHERIGLLNAGRTPAEMQQIEAAGRNAIGNLPTAGMTESMKIIAETTAAFGSVHHAIENLDFMQKAMSVLKASGGDKVGDVGSVGRAFAKTFEERQTRPEDFQKEARQMIPAMVVSGGTFNPQELYNFAQQAKSSLPSLSMRFLSKIAPSLIGAQGGDRAGTALNAFESVISGKAHDAKQAEAWEKLGLLDPKLTINKAGKTTAWKSGAVKDTFLAMTDPLAWSEKYLIPALQKQGIDTQSREAVKQALDTMFRNQNSNVFASEITQAASRARLHKDEALYSQAGSLEEIYTRNLQDFGVAAGALGTAIRNLGAAATAPLMSSAAKGLTLLVEGVNKAAKAGFEHPTLAGGAAVGAGALSLYGAGRISYWVMTGFGLPKAAWKLEAAATHLMEVGGGGGLGGVKGAVGGAAGTAGAATEGGLLARLGILGPELAGLGVIAGTAGLIKMSADAQQPGHGGQWAPATQSTRDLDQQRYADQKAEIADINRRIADIKARSNSPDSLGVLTQPLEDHRATLEGQAGALRRSLAETDPSRRMPWSVRRYHVSAADPHPRLD